MKVVFVSNFHDWEGLYIKGVLHAEGHKLDTAEMLNLVWKNSGTISCFEKREVNFDWLNMVGKLPYYIDDVLFADK